MYLYTLMNSRDVIAALRADGWYEAAQKGSHVQLKHPVKPGRVTVAHPSREIASGTLRSIENSLACPFGGLMKGKRHASVRWPYS